MNKLLSIAIALLMGAIALPVTAQDLVPDENEKGKWGYINDDGESVIPYKYDEAYGFIDGIAKVRKGDKYGYINPSNQPVIPLKYQEINPVPGRPGVYKVALGKLKDGVLLDAKYGYVDANGAILLKPEFEEIGQFTDGLAYVMRGGKYGYINTDFQFVIPCEFASIGSFNDDGVVWVNQGGKPSKDNASVISGGKFGLYNREGQVVIPVKYGSIGVMAPWYSTSYWSEDMLKQCPFYLRRNYMEAGIHYLVNRHTLTPKRFSKIGLHNGRGYFVSSDVKGAKNGVVDYNGNELVKPGKYNCVFFPEEGVSVVTRGGQAYNYLDLATGKLLFKKDLTDAYGFQDGVAVMQDRDGLYYMIDTQGNHVTSGYKFIFARKDGVYVCYDGTNFGLLGTKGEEILPCTYNVIISSSLGKLVIREKADGLFGYINPDGSYAIAPKYKDARSYTHGYAYVKDENGWGALLPSGENIVPCAWKDIYNIQEDNPRYVWVTADDKLAHCFDTETGCLAFPKGYTGMRTFNQDYEGIAIVWQGDNNIGCIDTEGNEIIPPELPSVAAVREGYNMVLDGTVKKWKPVHSYRARIKVDPKRHKSNLTDKIPDQLWDF